MHAFRSLCSRGSPLTLAAAGCWASSAKFERRTFAEPASKVQDSPQVTQAKRSNDDEQPSTGDGESTSPFPPPIGPMVAVYLDQSSVDKLKKHYPEAREGQLRKVIIQYGPSASERQMYQRLFSEKAQVTLTGEASSFGRRALVASVTHDGEILEPASLSAALDISPPIDDPTTDETDGPGPLASAALVEQIKRVEATKEVFWQGTLPPLQAHHRQFPSEDGAFVRLKEPITVSGTICRADWVDGASTRCRDTLDGGEPRQEDWKASGCSICAVFEVSPCSAIFTNKFVAASRRYDAFLEAIEPKTKQASDGGGGNGDDVAADDDERATVRSDAQDKGNPGDQSRDERIVNTGVTPATVTDDQREKSGRGAEIILSNPEAGKSTANEAAVGEGYDNDRETVENNFLEKELKSEVLAAAKELSECMAYHDM